jgi:thioesterase domain-containing protein
VTPATPATPDAAIAADVLRAHLRSQLPAYMVPAAYVTLPALPLTPHRKVDRAALPPPGPDAYARVAYEAPHGPIETALATIWQDVLHVPRIGRHDDFFALGGHSLLAVQLIAKINHHLTHPHPHPHPHPQPQALSQSQPQTQPQAQPQLQPQPQPQTHAQRQKPLPLAVLFTAPTIAELAGVITAAQAPTFDMLVPIQTRGDGLPIFALPGAGGNVLSLRPLGTLLGDAQPLFGLQAIGLDGSMPFERVEDTALASIAAIRTLQPKGPYHLIGHSYGGVVAYAMACALLERGEDIASLILLDSLSPALYQQRHADEADEDDDADLLNASSNAHANANANANVNANANASTNASANDLDITRDQLLAFQRVHRANVRAYRAYAPAPLPRAIDVTLFRALTRSSRSLSPLPADYGWSPLFPNPLRIIDVNADHFSILNSAPLRSAAAIAI